MSTIKFQEKLTINVIFVKGTVEILLPFLPSLLTHSSCRFRLISNGCLLEEATILKEFTDFNTQTVFYSLNTERILQHHEVLHNVLELEESEWFAFIDSDIVAKSQFLPALFNALEGKDAVFTGLPLWHETYEMMMPKDFNIMGGRFVNAHNGYLLGLSYAAIYKTSGLKNFIKSSGIDLRKYRWNEIPANYQQILNELGLKKQLYDTAKLLNILWQYEGGEMVFRNSDELIHLGGVSGPAYQMQHTSKPRALVSKLTPKWIFNILKRISMTINKVNQVETTDLQRLVKKRKITEALMSGLLYGTHHNFDEIDMAFLPPEMVERITIAMHEVRSIVKQSNTKPY